MMPDPRITGDIHTRAGFHLESGIFKRIDARFAKQLAILLASLQLVDEALTNSQKEE